MLIVSRGRFEKMTPANLGVQEAVVASSSYSLGIGFEKGLLAAGLVRVIARDIVE